MDLEIIEKMQFADWQMQNGTLKNRRVRHLAALDIRKSPTEEPFVESP
jgi:hypothetical protein